MSRANDDNRTPTPNPVQMHLYTDENGWTTVDPDVPLSQQPIASSWFTNPSQPGDQHSGFRAMYLESSSMMPIDQPQQRGMMISAGIPPLNRTDNQGVSQTPIQAFMFHSNNPFANIPPPPGFENFSPPISWGPNSLPIPPLSNPPFNPNQTSNFGYPQMSPFSPTNRPVPSPWVVNSFQTNTTYSGTMEQTRFPPTNSEGSSKQDKNRNTNNTANLWNLRDRQIEGDVLDGNHLKSTVKNCYTANDASGTEKLNIVDIDGPFGCISTFATEDCWKCVCPDELQQQQLKQYYRYHNHQFESNTQNSQPDSNNKSLAQKMWFAKRYQMMQRERTADPMIQLRSHRPHRQDAVESGKPSAISSKPINVQSEICGLIDHRNSPLATADFYRPCACKLGYAGFSRLLPTGPTTPNEYATSQNLSDDNKYLSFPCCLAHTGQTLAIPRADTSVAFPLADIRSGGRSRPTVIDKATSTNEPITGFKTHKTVWGIFVPLIIRPLFHETLIEQHWIGDEIENLASVDLNAMHKVQAVELHPNTCKCGYNNATLNRQSDSSDSLLTAFLNLTSNKFSQELRRLESNMTEVM